MSVLNRPGLHRTPTVPTPRSAVDDGLTTTPRRRRAAAPTDRTSRRRRAALALAALLAAVVAGITTAVVQSTGDEPTTLAPAELSGVTELDRLRDEMMVRRQLNSDANRATDAARDAAIASR